MTMPLCCSCAHKELPLTAEPCADCLPNMEPDGTLPNWEPEGEMETTKQEETE